MSQKPFSFQVLVRATINKNFDQIYQAVFYEFLCKNYQTDGKQNSKVILRLF